MKAMTVEGLSPILFGSGRPFGTEPGSLLAETLPLPLPTTLAGAVRNELARRANWMDYEEQYKNWLLQVRVRGPVLFIDGKPVFRAPADSISSTLNGQQVTVPAFPTKNKDGVLLPDEVLSATGFIQQDGLEPDKGERSPFWSGDRLLHWLANTDLQPQPLQEARLNVVTESRIHVQIDPTNRRHEHGQLFETVGVCLGQGIQKSNDDEVYLRDWKLWLGYEVPADVPDAKFGVFTLGGERRLAMASPSDTNWLEEYRKSSERVLESCDNKVRLYLATPALFEKGWFPNVDQFKKRCGVQLKLISACVSRRQPMTGWEIHQRRPRTLRYMAQAGSVYFFEVTSGNAENLAKLTFESVSDHEQERRDGFGLALWGAWKYLEENK
jgi:CRISPR-associated protein Cmr3